MLTRKPGMDQYGHGHRNDSVPRIRRSFPKVAALLCAAASICAAMLSAGCSGVTDFTGGGVPVGPSRAQLSGQVIQSANPSQFVPGATLTLVTNGGAVFTGVTDAAGGYQFMGIPTGTATLQVSPPGSANLRAQSLIVDVAADSTFAVVAALPPKSGYTVVSSITLSPSSLNLRVGQSATVTASIQGKDIPVGAQPSLVVMGGVGQVFPGGTFTATHAGFGSIVASLDGQTATIPVTVQ